MSAEHPQHAVVISGGGADGAYAVGVIKALCNGRSPTTGGEPLHPDIFVGTSIGCFNAAFLASHWDQYGPAAVANLERVWLERLAQGQRGNGIFRIRGNPFDLFNPYQYIPNPVRPLQQFAADAGFVGLSLGQRLAHIATGSESFSQRLLTLFSPTIFIDTKPMMAMLHEVIDYHSLHASSKVFRGAATSWVTGKLRIFENHDMTEKFGPLAIAASAAIPGFFPEVEFGAQPYVDGSVLSNTPLQTAIHAGADVLHVVYLAPKIENIPLAQMRNFAQTYYRMQQINWAQNVDDEAADEGVINRGLASLRRLPDADSEAKQCLSHVMAEIAGLEDSSKFRPLTIFRYTPRDPLSDELGLLDFRRQRLAQLIERGYHDAVGHDFDLDIFPDEDARKAALTAASGAGSHHHHHQESDAEKPAAS